MSNFDFEKFIEELMATASREPFEPFAWYCETGDILHVYLTDEGYYARWNPNWVDVLYAQDGGKIMGFNIWNASKLSKNKPKPVLAENKSVLLYSQKYDSATIVLKKTIAIKKESPFPGLLVYRDKNDDVVMFHLRNIRAKMAR
jgi:hypothetical protein